MGGRVFEKLQGGCGIRDALFAGLLVVPWCFSKAATNQSVVRTMADVDDTTADDTWSGFWTCDELTPCFCELRNETGELAVRGGVRVRYWVYTATSRRPSSRDHNDQTPDLLLLPILVLHGGPGFPHNYLLPLKQQACRGRTVVFYDQAGCGQSALLQDNTSIISGTIPVNFPWLLDPLYYATEELPTIISHLRLDRYHIIAHSWGTMQAQLFALENNKPKGLVSMVLSGPLSDSKLWESALWGRENGTLWDRESGGILGQLPPFVQARIKHLEALEMYDSPEYLTIANAVTAFSVCRTSPLPDCYRQSERTMNKEIYVRMQGPSEFTNGGVLAGFNTTGRLHELASLPILLTYGKFDTIAPVVVETMHRELPLSEVFLFPRSGHVTAIDEPGAMHYIVADFFDRVEAAVLGQQSFVPRQQVEQGVVDDDDHQQCVIMFAVVLLVAAGILAGMLLSNILLPRLSARRRNREGYQVVVS